MGQSSTAADVSDVSVLLQQARDYYLNAKPKTWADFLTDNQNSLQLWRLHRDDGQPSHALLISRRAENEVLYLPENVDITETEGIVQHAVCGLASSLEVAHNLQPYECLYIYHGHTNFFVALILGTNVQEMYLRLAQPG